MIAFEKLGLSSDIIDTLKNKGFKKPTAIQEKTIPLLLKGEVDVIGQAQTGTGKTASFSLPVIETITPGTGYVQALVLAPTRELAIQVSTEIDSLRGKRPISVLPIYGGSSITHQIKVLRKGVDIVVGTPGRIMDLMRRKELHLKNVSFLILDEADEMLNMGFLEDIEWILSHTPEEKRMLFFSATMPRPILQTAKKYMRDYTIIKIESKELTIDTIDQVYFPIKSNQRYPSLKRVIAINKNFHAIIFCKTKRNVDDLSHRLVADKYAAAALHGDVTQSARTRILNQFRKGAVKILVATDVAARGIDVNDITHVINYSLPQSPELYVHRIGRTGRAGKEGTAITFLIPSEAKKLKFIEKITNKEIKRGKVPDVKEVIQSRKDNMIRSIRRIINKRDSSQFEDVTEILLEKDDAKTVVSALLKHIMQHEVEKNDYQAEVEEYVAKEPRGRGRSSGNRGSGSRDRGRNSGSRDRRPRRDSGSRDSRPRRDSSDRRPRRDSGSRDSRPRRDSSDRRPRRDSGSRDSRPRRDSDSRDSRPRRDSSDSRPRRDSGSRDSRPRSDSGSRDSKPRRNTNSNDKRPRRY
jgi:ATP-dependent RNA helicase DeaD